MSDLNQWVKPVVLVPGMFTPSFCLHLQAKHLRERGFEPQIVRNRFWSDTPANNAQRLLQLLRAVNSRPMNLVGHSLGGIVILHMLQLNAASEPDEQLQINRVVLIASPVNGSRLAEKMHAKRLFRTILGRSVDQGLLGGAPQDLNGVQTGVISGAGRAGLAAMFYRPKTLNDGVVETEETLLAGASDTVCLPQSHAIMLFSKGCATKAAQFLKSGRF